eukprot:4547730-Alexandrium_andersonii.AAC.1
MLSGGSPEALRRLSRCSPELSGGSPEALRSPPGLHYAAWQSSQTGYGSGYSQFVMATNSQARRREIGDLAGGPHAVLGPVA